MKTFFYACFLLVTPTAFAAVEPVGASEVGKLFGGLLVVVAVIFWGAWLAKKFNLGNRFSNNDCIKIVSLLSLGAKEKVILIEVGGEQIVIGSSNQGLQHLHTLKTPVEMTAAVESDGKSFATQLKGFLNKSQSKQINSQDDV